MALGLHPEIETAVVVLHYSLPVLISAYYIASSIFSACYLRSTSLKVKDQHVRRHVIVWLMIALVATYFCQAVNILIEALFDENSVQSQHENVFVISSIVVWGTQVLAIIEAEFPIWYPYYGSWIIGIFSEASLAILINIYHKPETSLEVVDVMVSIVRAGLFVSMLLVYYGIRDRPKAYENLDEERQVLLQPNDGESDVLNKTTAPGYGSIKAKTTAKLPTAGDDEESEADADDLKQVKEDEERMLRRLKQDGSFWAYLRGFRVFLPHMLPLHSKILQLRGVLVIFCLLASNALNVLLPRQFGIVVDLLSGHSHNSVWVAATVYAALLFLSQGCIAWVRYWLWLPIEQFGQESLVVAAHSHVMNLSSDFHDGKESFEIHQAVSQGAHVTGIVETVCFEIFPMLVDLCLATAYLYWLFGPYLALVVATTALVYIYTTSKLVSLSNDKRRMLNALWRRQWSRGYQSIDGWVTASLFNNVEHEEARYARSVSQRLEATWNYGLTYRFIAVAQVFVMTVGLLAASYLAIYQVLYGNKTPGDFATLFMYWAQLRGPLVFFSRVYKELSDNMMDAERLLELLQTEPTVVDRIHAKNISLTNCEVQFSDVSHTYDERKPGLKNIDFTVPGGTTIALVGETGSGKSTIMKLINRFYDVDSGSIMIDGQDIRDVTMTSLRAAIGVVPQDPSIFDGTIFNNVSYGRLGCTIQDVHDACKAAAIHEKIISMPDGYFTKVGRRGVKLSGGERQRLAIARTILKNPPIIILDEATSALDTDTEQNIQDALRALSEGRTTFVVAHRLSTIINADRILVIKDGRIIENGSHEELIQLKGKYNDLWSKQITVKSAKSQKQIKNAKSQAATTAGHDLKAGNPQVSKLISTASHTEVASSKHKRDNSKSSTTASFRPNAPEFVPKPTLPVPEPMGANASSMASNNSTMSKQDAKEAKKAKELQKKQEKEERKAAIKNAKRQGSHQVDGAVDVLSCANKSKHVDDSQAPGQTTGDTGSSGGCQVQFRKPHQTNRRNNCKSEPVASRLSLEHSTDGTEESEDTLTDCTGPARKLDPSVVSGQMATKSSNQRRRVTAPSDSQADLPPADVQARNVRRQSHWRLKNGADNSGSASDSSKASEDSEVTEYETTMVPAPSPASSRTSKRGEVKRIGGT